MAEWLRRLNGCGLDIELEKLEIIVSLQIPLSSFVGIIRTGP